MFGENSLIVRDIRKFPISIVYGRSARITRVSETSHTTHFLEGKLDLLRRRLEDFSERQNGFKADRTMCQSAP